MKNLLWLLVFPLLLSCNKEPRGCIVFYEIKTRTNHPLFILRIEPKSTAKENCVCSKAPHEFAVAYERVSDVLYDAIYDYINTGSRKFLNVYDDNRFQYAIAVKNTSYKLYSLSYTPETAIRYLDGLRDELIGNPALDKKEVQLVIRDLAWAKEDFN